MRDDYLTIHTSFFGLQIPKKEKDDCPGMYQCEYCKENTYMCTNCGYCWCTKEFISKEIEDHNLCTRCQCTQRHIDERYRL